jgi:hypothetical protein
MSAVLHRWTMLKRCFLLLPFVLLLTGCDPKFWKIQMWMWSENHKSLDFYGKIVDQDGLPVDGVRVTAGVGTYVSFTESGGTKYFTVSDAEGRFSFIGIHGSGCGYLPEKPGYEFSQRQAFASRPEDYVPDPNNPAVLKMWKLHGAERMIKARIHGYIPCDGTPTVFNLTTGKGVSIGGNFTVRLVRNPVNIVRGKPFDWQLTLEVSGGGMKENTDLYPYEAPAAGYQHGITVNMPAGTRAWSPDYQKAFYFTAGNGQDYGRINIDLTGDFQPPPTSFDADIYVNTAGSRNLEFDPFKQIHSQ